MGILDRILRAGEGKKVKALEGIVPDINALGSGDSRRLSDDALQAKTAEFRERLDNGADLDDLLDRGVRRHPRGRHARHRPTSLRRAA